MRLAFGLTVGVMIARVCLAQTPADPDVEARQVKEWVERDIAKAKAFAAAPENTHVRMVGTRGQFGTPEQVQEYESTMAAMRRAVEGKPDHPLREDMRIKWRFAPGASELLHTEFWIGTIDGVGVSRSSFTYLNDVLNEGEREIDKGDNGRVFWEKLGRRSIVRVAKRDRVGQTELSAHTGTAFEALFGWFGVLGSSRTPAELSYKKVAGGWEVGGLLDGATWKAQIEWDAPRSSGFVVLREMQGSNSGIRVSRSRGDRFPGYWSSGLRIDYLAADGTSDPYFEYRDIEVNVCGADELRRACELPEVGISSSDPVRESMETHRVHDLRIPSTRDSSLWTQEVRSSLVIPEIVAAGKGAEKIDDRRTGIYWLIGGIGLVIAASLGGWVWCARMRTRIVS